MRRILTATALAMALPGVMFHSTASQAQPAPKPQTTAKFGVEYREPRYLGIYQRLKARKILEELAEFMSPLQLDRNLKLQIDDDDYGSSGSICRGNSANSYYDPSTYIVHICYNWFEMVEKQASVQVYRDPKEFVYWTPVVTAGKLSLPTPGRMPGFTRGEVIIGGSVSNILHELGHAVRHNLDLPRLGREEDTADQLAGFIMLQFGKDVALPTIKGAINVWHHLQAVDMRGSGGKIDASDQADVHSIHLQRGLNYLCLAFGSPHSAEFKALADQWLRDDRKENCKNEYKTVSTAFDMTVRPKINDAQLKKVQAMKILNPEDLK
jgi:hypothetical protein